MNQTEKLNHLKNELKEYKYLISITKYGLEFTIPGDSNLLEEILHKLNRSPYLQFVYISHEIGYYDSIDACVMEFRIV